MQAPTLQLKRIYEAPTKKDGLRILVDRLWPRGLTKQKASLDHWLKDLAPSTELRKWFHQDIKRWPEFKIRYLQELKTNTSSVTEALNLLKSKPRTTLLSANKNKTQNHATLLKDFLEEKLKGE